MSDPNPLAELAKTKADLQRLGRPMSRILIPRVLWDQLMKAAPPKLNHPSFGDTFQFALVASAGVPVRTYTNGTTALEALAGCNAEDRVGLLLPGGKLIDGTPYQVLVEISKLPLVAPAAPTTPPAAV